VLKSVVGSDRAIAVRSETVKEVVAADAMRSWPDGGWLAKRVQGEEKGHAMCSG
jgi:hypothetical protein